MEDNKADVYLICAAIEGAKLEADLQIITDGEKALQFFEQADRDECTVCPALVILDINLPRKDGAQVLQEMRMSRRCANAPVLIVTSSDSTRDREAMAKLGAKGYFRKPSEYADFMKLGPIVKLLLDQIADDSPPQ